MSAWPFRPGDPVATTHRIQTALADVPAFQSPLGDSSGWNAGGRTAQQVIFDL